MATQKNTSYGLSAENPILMRSIPETYSFLHSLCFLRLGLSFKRQRSLFSLNFNHPIDYYLFYLNDNHFADIYVYSYHKENILSIPAPFIVERLN